MIFTNVEAIAKFSRDHWATDSVIVIDGWTGSGKSSLAGALAAEVGAEHFDLVSALNRDQGSYVPSLNSATVRNAIDNRSGALIVSGICALKVLDMVGVDPDVHIYVKRMAAWGWADDLELEGGISEIPGSGEVVRNELRAYHKKWRPHVLAAYEYHWPS